MISFLIFFVFAGPAHASTCDGLFNATWPGDLALHSNRKPFESTAIVYFDALAARSKLSEDDLRAILDEADRIAKRRGKSELAVDDLHAALVAKRSPLITLSQKIQRDVWLPHVQSKVDFVLGRADHGTAAYVAEITALSSFIQAITAFGVIPKYRLSPLELIRKTEANGFKTLEDFEEALLKTLIAEIRRQGDAVGPLGPVVLPKDSTENAPFDDPDLPPSKARH